MKKLESIVTITIVMAILPVLLYGQWNIETVDTAGTVGRRCAIAVDANGYPHISYRDDLKYAHWDGSQWQIAFVETTESVYGVTSIALDGSGNPHIAFEKGIWYGGQLWHAWWDGSNWQQEGVDSLPYNGHVGEWNSIAFGTDGYPHIAYTYYTNTGTCYIKYAYKDASGWHTQVADSLIGDEFQYVSMALDGNNIPHISYYDWNVSDLKYAYWDGATWHVERVDTTGGVGTCSSIALDSLDYPQISYTDGTNNGLKYARWDGSSWQIETIGVDIGDLYTSLALDANDRPHISSAEYMADLRFAYWDGSDWQIEVVDNTVCCDWTSLAIDNSGYCHIAYYDGGDSTNLKYARRLPTGIEETYPIPEVLHLAQNYPNPFNSATSISYVLPRNGFVRLAIYNISGQLVRTLVKGEKFAGTHTVIWNRRDEQGSSVNSGIYFYCLETGNLKSTRTMLLLK